MKVAAATSTARPEAARPAREVEPRRTQATRGELRAAIARALQRETGAPANPKLVDTLTAHASLETASGDRMYNWNFAGIKGASPSGTTAVLRTKEVVDGREISIKDGFRAYASIDEGAQDYVRLMRGRFSGSMDAASRGDLDGFAHALKQSGYYTASERDYAKGLASLSGTQGAAAPARSAAHPARAALPNTSLEIAVAKHDLASLLTSSAADSPASDAVLGIGAACGAPSSLSLGRVNDALDVERWGASFDSVAMPSPRRHAERASRDDDEA